MNGDAAGKETSTTPHGPPFRGRRRHENVHHAARSAFYEKVSLSSVGEDH